MEHLVRTCDGCGQTDDHPHHIMYAAISFVDPITQKPTQEDRSVSRHFDCCNCDHCSIVIRHAYPRKGQDLREFIQSKPEALHIELSNAGYEVS